MTSRDKRSRLSSIRSSQLGDRCAGLQLEWTDQACRPSFESTLSYGYDGGGRLTTVGDSSGDTLTLGHDDLDNLTSEQSTLGTVTYGARICELRREHPGWGPPRIEHELAEAGVARGAPSTDVGRSGVAWMMHAILR
jgi:YD repeat-containing protein